jgi:CRISPR system Cascade subunit CasE
MTLYLSRARLKRTASIAALGRVLLPDDESQRAMAAHHLVWSLFAGDPSRKRDFLWREDQQGVFFILSPQPPLSSEIFEAETKEFAPSLAPGETLRFSLRANATKSYKATPGKRGKRADVVMATIHGMSKCERSEQRTEIASSAGCAWLAAQGAQNGFYLPNQIVVSGYNKFKLPRPGKREKIEINTLEFTGILEITDPVKFLAKLASGFGRARAFGCGLMLIRRP